MKKSLSSKRRPLNKEEVERYNVYPHTREAYTLFEHCHRAIEKGATSGPHGLPLIGSGDWNDAYNRVGAGARVKASGWDGSVRRLGALRDLRPSGGD